MPPTQARPAADPILAAYQRLGDKTAVARELGVARSTVIKRIAAHEAETQAASRRARAAARPRDRWPLAPRLRTLLQARFPSLSAAALAIGIGQPSLWRIAHGRPPKPETLTRILQGIGATFEELCRAEPDTESNVEP